MLSKLERRLFSSDSQEVGLEAAILERKRKSSLVEENSAEDLTRIKRATEDREALVGELCSPPNLNSKFKMKNSKLKLKIQN